jgi:hypothetical protein
LFRSSGVEPVQLTRALSAAAVLHCTEPDLCLDIRRLVERRRRYSCASGVPERCACVAVNVVSPVVVLFDVCACSSRMKALVYACWRAGADAVPAGG